MGPFGVRLWISHYLGLLVQLGAASQASGNLQVDNHVSGNALFTEVPHDMVTESGQDVEMACSFRGAGSSSVSLEIQWWYLQNKREWAEKPAWTTNQVVPTEDMTRDATKISVVKVAGSNISHRLRLSSVKPADEGTYECRVIDFSDNRAQHHRVRAYLQVQSPGLGMKHHQDHHLTHGGEQNAHHKSPHLHKGQSDAKEKEKQNNEDDKLHHEDYKLHQKQHHSSHHGDPATEGEKETSSALHHRRDHQRSYEEDHHQVTKHTQAYKKSQAKNQHSEVKGHKAHVAENPSDCSTDGCVL